MRIDMTIILLTGMPGCGKEEFLRIAEGSGYDIVRMGDVVRERAEQNGISMTDKGVGTFADRERKDHHYGIWAERTVDRLGEEKTVIDGVRSPEEVETFKEEIEKGLFIVAIHASPETRYERLKKRAREDSPETKEEFDERDERELNWGLGDVIARADKMVVNEGSLQRFQEEVEELFEGLDDL